MVNDFKKAFGLRVRYYRELLNYSQEQLAEMVGISANTVGYIERGKNSISMAKLSILCKVLQVKPYQLFLDIGSDTDASVLSKIEESLKFANSKQLNIIYNLIRNIMDL